VVRRKIEYVDAPAAEFEATLRHEGREFLADVCGGVGSRG
jgi:hypothetical protein